LLNSCFEVVNNIKKFIFELIYERLEIGLNFFIKLRIIKKENISITKLLYSKFQKIRTEQLLSTFQETKHPLIKINLNKIANFIPFQKNTNIYSNS